MLRAAFRAIRSIVAGLLVGLALSATGLILLALAGLLVAFSTVILAPGEETSDDTRK